MRSLLLGAVLLTMGGLAPAAFAQTQTAPVVTRLGMLNLRVTDLDRSERFYREAFGLAAPRAYNPRERVFTLDPAGARIELELSEIPQRNGSFSMIVADVDAVVARTPGAGGAVVRPAGAPANNYRTAVITDPDGVEIEVLQPMPRN